MTFIIGLIVGLALGGLVAGSIAKDLEADKEYLLDLIQQYNGGQEVPHRSRWAHFVFRPARKEFKS